MDRNDHRLLAEQLERDVDGQEAELPAGLTHVSASLRQATRQTRPRPGFVNELARELRQEQQAVAEQRAKRQTIRSGLRRVLSIAGALAALAALVFAASYFYQPDLEPAVTEQETGLPPIVRRAVGGMFFGIEFRLHEPLSGEPEQLPLYRAEAAPLPSTATEVRQMAVALGMDNPQIYQVAAQTRAWVAQDEIGRRLTINNHAVRFPIVYHAPNDTLPSIQTSSPDVATRAASFLEPAGLLPESYETRQRVEESLINVEIIPTLDGRPVHYASSEVDLRPDGMVVEARIQTLVFTPTVETVTAQSGREAFDEVLQSGATVDITTLTLDGMTPRTLYPSLAAAQVGDEVRLQGFITVIEPADGGEIRVELIHNLSRSRAFRIVGPLATELAGEQLVEVNGTLVAQEADKGWTVQVGSWQTPPIDGQVVDCKSGILHQEGEQMVLLTDERVPFALAYPPLELAGERVEVCAIFRSAPYPLPWLSVTHPPARDLMPSVSTTSSDSAAEDAQVVEVTRVIVHEAGSNGVPTPPEDAVRFVTEQIVDADGTVITTTQPVELRSPGLDSSYAIGQEVEVSGIVGGYLQREEDQVVPYISLVVDTDNDPTTRPVNYPLAGPWSLLLEIAKHYQMHVTIPATIVEAQGEHAGPEGQAIEVGEGGWWRTWPEEEFASFLGHYEVATLEGREVRLFVDEATGNRYVDAIPLYYAQPGDTLLGEHGDGRLWITGVVHPEDTVGGLPLLTILQQRSGAEIDQLNSASERPIDPQLMSMPLRDSISSPAPRTTADTLIIDRAVLGYTYLPPGPGEATGQLLQPTWLFYGRSAESTTYFVLRVPAVDDMNN
jgi:hypothetical protein